MAVVFNKEIATNKLLMAFNNNIVKFGSDSTTLFVMYAEIKYASVVITLFPNPQGEFYYNYSDFIKNLMVSNNMSDDLVVDIANNGYVYSWTNKVFLTTNIEYEIYLSDLTSVTATRNYQWLAGVLQLEEYKRRYPLFLDTDNCIMLSPFVKQNNNKAYVKYWDGYPFDITIYSNAGDTIDIELTNKSNLLSYTFPASGSVNRLVFGDGQTTETIESVLPLQFGRNEMQIEAGESIFYFDLIKEEDTCGTYLKWRNSFGGWNYWLFPKGMRNRNVKDIGELENDFNNIEDTIAPTVQIGRMSNDSINLTTDILNEYDMVLISDMIESPKLYMFTGSQYSQNTYNDWLEVSLKTTDFRTENAKTDFNRFNFVIELPMRNTVTL
jgi:hypothetical protein